jgi:hypothetical protein
MSVNSWHGDALDIMDKYETASVKAEQSAMFAVADLDPARPDQRGEAAG